MDAALVLEQQPRGVYIDRGEDALAAYRVAEARVDRLRLRLRRHERAGDLCVRLVDDQVCLDRRNGLSRSRIAERRYELAAPCPLEDSAAREAPHPTPPP